MIIWLILVIFLLTESQATSAISRQCDVTTDVTVDVNTKSCNEVLKTVHILLDKHNSYYPENPFYIEDDFCSFDMNIRYEDKEILLRVPGNDGESASIREIYRSHYAFNSSRPIKVSFDLETLQSRGQLFVAKSGYFLRNTSAYKAKSLLAYAFIKMHTLMETIRLHFKDIRLTGPTKDYRFSKSYSPHVYVKVESFCTEGYFGNRCCDEVRCGDGIVAGTEQCDNKDDVGDTSACPRCRNAYCGDGFLFSNDENSVEECESTLRYSPGTKCDQCILRVHGFISNPNGVSFKMKYPATATDGTFSMQLFHSDKDGNRGSVFKKDEEPHVCTTLTCETPLSWGRYILPDSWYILRTDFLRKGASNLENDFGFSWSEPALTPCGCSYDNPTGLPKNMRVHQNGNIMEMSYIQDSGCATAIQARRMLKFSNGQFDRRPVLVGTKQYFSGNPIEQCGVESEGDFKEEIGDSIGTKLTLGSIHQYCLTITGKPPDNRGTIIDYCTPEITIKWTGRIEIRIRQKDVNSMEAGVNVTVYSVTDEGRRSRKLERICGDAQCAPFEECIDNKCQASSNESLVFKHSYVSSSKHERLDLVVPGVTDETQRFYVIASKYTAMGEEVFRHRFYCNNDMENTGTGYVLDIAVSETFRTSDYPGNPGRYSDMVLIPSVSIKYNEAVNLYFDEELCSLERKSAFTWTPDNIANSFSFVSIFDIEVLEMPQIKRIQDAAEEAYLTAKASGNNATAMKEALKFATAKEIYNGWKSVVDRNDELKESAVSCTDPEHCINVISGTFVDEENLDNINDIVFTGGGSLYSYEREFSNISTISTTTTIWSETDRSHGLEVSGRLFGIGTNTESAYATVTTTNWESVGEESTGVGNVITFELGDPDIGDKFRVAILTDPVYKTPVFRTLSGRTRCPIEDGTTQREKISVEVLRSHLTNIKHDESAEFPVIVYNESPTGENIGFYNVELSTASNPDGLVVSLFGEGLGLYTIPSFDDDSTSLKLPLVVSRGPEAYRYRDVEISLYAPCEDELDVTSESDLSVEATIIINVDFIAPCAQVSFGGNIGRNRQFVIIYDKNPSKLSTLNVELKNPAWPEEKWSDLFASNTLERVVLQYRFYRDVFKDHWITAVDNKNQAIEITDIDDSASGVVNVVWKAPMHEGKFELRAISYCGAEFSSSFIIPGLVDFTAPAVFDFAEPVDGVYYPGDKISIQFTEDINCEYPFKFKWNAIIVDSDTTIDLQLFCSSNEVQLSFLPNYYLSLMDHIVEVSVSEFSDRAGNIQNAPVSWRFKIAKLILEDASTSFTNVTLAKNFIKVVVGADPQKAALSKKKFGEALRKEIASVIDASLERVVVDVDTLSGNSSITIVNFSLIPGNIGQGRADVLSQRFFDLILSSGNKGRRNVEDISTTIDSKTPLIDSLIFPESIIFNFIPGEASSDPGGSSSPTRVKFNPPPSTIIPDDPEDVSGPTSSNANIGGIIAGIISAIVIVGVVGIVIVRQRLKHINDGNIEDSSTACAISSSSQRVHDEDELTDTVA